MARIDWAVACDHAFLDCQERLCLIGVLRSVAAPMLPMALPQVTLVARLADIQPVDEIDVAVGMVTPSGVHAGRIGSPSVRIEMAREYVLATFREVTVTEEGIHHFQVRLRGQPIVSLGLPVVAAHEVTASRVQ